VADDLPEDANRWCQLMSADPTDDVDLMRCTIRRLDGSLVYPRLHVWKTFVELHDNIDKVVRADKIAKIVWPACEPCNDSHRRNLIYELSRALKGTRYYIVSWKTAGGWELKAR
jgi:hypothetical protein